MGCLSAIARDACGGRFRDRVPPIRLRAASASANPILPSRRSRLPTSLPPAALLAIKQNLAAQGRKQQQAHSEPTHNGGKTQRAARAAPTPTTPTPG